MAERKSKTRGASSKGFTEEERATMKERAKELKAEARASRSREEGERDLLAKIAEMPPADRVLAQQLHELVTATAPELTPKTWYGMPAWARDGKVVCFFKPASKFDARYATFGFEDAARIDEGSMFVTSFGLTELTKADGARIVELVKRA